AASADPVAAGSGGGASGSLSLYPTAPPGARGPISAAAARAAAPTAHEPARVAAVQPSAVPAPATAPRTAPTDAPPRPAPPAPPARPALRLDRSPGASIRQIGYEEPPAVAARH